MGNNQALPHLLPLGLVLKCFTAQSFCFPFPPPSYESINKLWIKVQWDADSYNSITPVMCLHFFSHGSSQKKPSTSQCLKQSMQKQIAPPQHLLKIIPACVSPFLFVLPARWGNITGTQTTFSTSSTEIGTHLHKEILGKQGKPDALKGHKLLPWFAYTSTLQHHSSAVLACFSPLLCKQTKPSFPRCLPVFNWALKGGANVEGNLEKWKAISPAVKTGSKRNSS